MNKIKRSKSSKSEVTLASKSSNLLKIPEPEFVPPMDNMIVKVMSLRLADEPPTRYAVKVTFFNQLILSGIIITVGARAVEKATAVIKGNMSYDPSDYEKMCLFADCPLVVQIQPLKDVERSTSKLASQISNLNKSSSSVVKTVADISCCNVDILPIFLNQDKICIRKRMEPMVEPRALQMKSWDNLPLLTLEVSVQRNSQNKLHHDLLKKANLMKITAVAACNMIEPFNNEFTYTAATKMPLHNETNTTIMPFCQGHKVLRRFSATAFYPSWESIRQNDELFARGDMKFTYALDQIQNEHGIDLHYYLHKMPRCYTTVWGSFHRTLMLQQDEWLLHHLRHYKWPFEIHLTAELRSHDFMAFLNLFTLLYPGETKVCMAVPLHWINAHTMSEVCGCELLFTNFDNAASTPGSGQKPAKIAPSKDSEPHSTSTENDSEFFRGTGADGNTAFVIVEVTLARPLKKPFIPQHITDAEIAEMLAAIEATEVKRECIGRGHLDREWLSTLKTAVTSLRKVPHYGMTEFCNFNRQLSETRTRVELLTSFTNDAASYTNNNFIVQDFLSSDDIYEEMLLMAHACLMRLTCQMLVEVNFHGSMDPTLRAARHARHMQDQVHAKRLYMQVVVQNPRNANFWREMSTCYMDINREWGEICLTKSLQLNMRHPITLLAEACVVFDKDPEAAEIFFGAIMAMYPSWNTGWVIISAYYFEQQMYHMADELKAMMKKAKAEGLRSDDGQIGFPRCWDYELGDWWECTPLLPGMSVFYDAADLLLRLRAFTLAEVCMARALAEAGETAAYYHLVALCCRLKGDINEALCHVRRGLEKFGEINYLRALEAECLHKMRDFDGARASFDKAGSCIGAYSTLLGLPRNEPQRTRSMLVDLIRRQPNAYAWMALADDWMTRAEMGEGGDADITDEQTSAKTCAAACAVQALKWDRRAGRAWALLASLVSPSARRLHCREMAKICGYQFDDGKKEFGSQSQQSLCNQLGTALRECRCRRCSQSLLKL